jgi:hypothetical protein
VTESRAPGPETAPRPEGAPPLGSWARAYVVVLAALLVELVLLAWLTERYR